MQTTTRTELQELQDAGDSNISGPLILNPSAELLNAMISDESGKEDAKSKFCFHLRSGCNSENRASMSGRVFVLDKDGKPLTPCRMSKARKLLEGKQAEPVWNKFGEFGIQMLVTTRKETPKTVLGCDFGTKFEEYSVISGKENTMNVMWKLPDKKKLEERRTLRRARRFRNCRRRECRFDNREKKGFIAFIFALGFYLLFFDKGEQAILKRLEEDKNTNIENNRFEAMLRSMDEHEKAIIKAIKNQEGITQSTLKYRVNLSKAKISQVLTHFEKNNMIVRDAKGKTYEIFLRDGI